MTRRFVRIHLGVTALVTCVTAWFSYAYFHIDEYFQVLEFVRLKLGYVDPAVMPWEYKQAMRPWLQPLVYWLIARAFGLNDVFQLAFASRLFTGLCNLGALALFLRTTLPWMTTDEEKRMHVRVATLTGFLPYLFVRTSSESGSMAALTAAFALLLEGSSAGSARTWDVPLRPWRALIGGFLLGLAFEMRFQTVFVALGIVAWLAKMRARRMPLVIAGGVVAVAIGVLADRWGYGKWTFSPWTYLQANVFEGAAGLFGTEPPFAYFWMLPANVFLPVVIAFLALSVVAWVRSPWHPVTWATLPFFVIHNVLSHKEERFLFPIAVLSTALVTMALAPEPPRLRGVGSAASHRLSRMAAWGWARRWRWPAKALAAVSTAMMLFLAFVPLGWHHTVRFSRHLHDRFGDEVHALALPEIELSLPAFHPRVYDIEKADPEEIARRIEAGTARPWLITDRPVLRTETSLDAHATLVFTELPSPALLGLVEAYNARASGPFRKLHFRSLYRLHKG